MDLYAENILDHYRHPRGKQPLPDASVTHEEINHSCGDSICLGLRIENDIVKEIGWTGSGCAISQAAVSMLCEECEGKSLDQIGALGKEEVFAMLGVPVGIRRIKCALLGLHALRNAVLIAQGSAAQSWLETAGDA